MAAGTLEGVLWNIAGELGSSWRQVARVLGYSEASLEYLDDDIPKSHERAYQMLLRWKNRTEPSQRGEDLRRAFREAERQDLMPFVTSLTGLGHQLLQTGDFDVDVFIKKLKTFIKSRMSKLPLIPWISTGCVHIDQVFTNVQLLINIATAYLPVRLPLESYNAIFMDLGEENVEIYELSSTRVLVRGRTGSGKTTLLTKYAYDWCVNKPGALLTDAKVVFILPMRKLDQHSNLGQSVLDHMLPAEKKITASAIEQFCLDHPDKVVILLDGYDEFKGKGLDHDDCGNIVEMLRGDCFPDTQVVVTTRPGRVSDFQNNYESYRHIEITGFSSEDIDKYVRKVFQRAPDPDLGEKLILYLEENQLKDDLASIPLMLTAFCQLTKWTDGKDFGELNTVSKLFDRLIECVFEHEHCKTVNKRKPANLTASQSSTRFLTPDALVLELGKVALDGLLGNATEELIFSEDDFSRCVDREQVIEQGLRAGLLSRDEDSNIRPQNYEALGMKGQRLTFPKNISFILKSLQEKCAGSYLAHLLKENDGEQSFKEYLRRVDSAKRILDLVNILVFASGASIEAASRIISHVIHVLMDQRGKHITQYLNGTLNFQDCPETQRLIELCLQLNFESQAGGRFNNHFNTLFGESGPVRLVGISNYVAKALGYLFDHSEQQPSGQALSPTKLTTERNHVLSVKSLNLICVRLESSTQFREFLNCYTGAEKAISTFMGTSVSDNTDSRLPSLRKKFSASKGKMPKYLNERADDRTLFAVLPIWQEINKRKVHDFSLGFVLAGLKKCLLQELTLNGVIAEPKDWEELFKMMTSGIFANMKMLTLSLNDLTFDQTECLAAFLHSTPELRYLKLSGNQVGEGFVDNLQAMPHLENIILDSTKLSSRAMVEFTKKFKDFPGLHKIDLRRNEDTDDSVIHSICDKLSDQNMKELRLSLYRVSEEGLRYFQGKIGESPGLTHINLVHTPIPDRVIFYSALALSSLSQLVDLRISGIQSSISEEGALCTSTTVDKFTKELGKVQRLAFLSFLYIRMMPADFLKFLGGCRHHTSLKTFRFSRLCLPESDDVKTACDETEGKFLQLWV